MSRSSKPEKKPIEQNDHKGKERCNNPPFGLVIPETDSHSDVDILVISAIKEGTIGRYAGQDTQQDKTKREFLGEWVKAVNQHGGFGIWQWSVSRDPADIAEVLEKAGEA